MAFSRTFIELMITSNLILTSYGQTAFCDLDPCIPGNTLLLSSFERRKPSCLNDGLCDAYISPSWYQIPVPMASFCPNMFSCGTLFPVWMNGTEPSIEDGVVERTACLVGPKNCCTKAYKIKLKKCKKFIAYCLQNLGSCPEGYCFGHIDEKCPQINDTETTRSNIPERTKQSHTSLKKPNTTSISKTITGKQIILLSSSSMPPGTGNILSDIVGSNHAMFYLTLPEGVALFTGFSVLSIVCVLMFLVMIKGKCRKRYRKKDKDFHYFDIAPPCQQHVYTEINH